MIRRNTLKERNRTVVNTSIEQILAKYPNARRDDLIPILQKVQDACGFLSREAVIRIGEYLKLPASKIYGVATFYNQFRFQPQGTFNVQVCRGTACHVKGSVKVLDALVREMGIHPGETSRDGVFSLEVVSCIGACGLAPVIAINGEFYAGMTPEKVKTIIDSYRRKAEEHANS